MEQAIRLAISRGWKAENHHGVLEYNPNNRTGVHSSLRASYTHFEIFSDPLFWQALGKALSRESVEISVCGVKTSIDKTAIPLLHYRSWEITKKGYLRGTDKQGKKMFLHRLVKDAQEGEFIDHINGNKLDNRADNLKIVTLQENALNKRKTKLGQYRGVYWHPTKKKWVAQVRFQKKSYYGGYFNDKDDAAHAAEALRVRLFTGYHNGVTREWWLDTWHCFIDHLAEGKDPETFFISLLTEQGS